jgi:hypothetical protein
LGHEAEDVIQLPRLFWACAAGLIQPAGILIQVVAILIPIHGASA